MLMVRTLDIHTAAHHNSARRRQRHEAQHGWNASRIPQVSWRASDVAPRRPQRSPIEAIGVAELFAGCNSSACLREQGCDVLDILARYFADDGSTEGYLKIGPVTVAKFEIGEDEEVRERRILRQRDVADLINRFLKAVSI